MAASQSSTPSSQSSTRPPSFHSEASEETPLLATSKNEDVYQRFSLRKKKFIVLLVSWCGLVPLFTSGTFIPSIPEIAADLETDASVISLAVSLSILAGCLGNLAGASYSGYYGRRPTYLTSLPLLALASFGVALSPSVPFLMIFRFFQALGASPSMSLGAGVIGDIYRLEERGRALGWFFSATLLGAATAPPIGGFVSYYFSWRALQTALGLTAIGVSTLIFCYFPETCHPGTRGIDKVDDDDVDEEGEGRGGEKRRRRGLVWINPLKPLLLLRSPNLLFVSVVGFCTILTDFVLLVPLAYTIGPKFGITNPAIIGLCFIPAGLGNTIGAPIAGYLSDSVVIRWKKRRNGLWYPEDRLRAALLGASVLVPFSVLGMGWTMELFSGEGNWVGLSICLGLLFVNGVGVDMVLSPCAAYGVDVMGKRSVESVAAGSGIRSLLLSPAIASIMPCIEMYGVGWTDTIAAVIASFGCVLLLLVIRYGNEMRAWADVGFVAVEN